jgi:predicted anti-sigma-YlaC factor YlaD
MMTDPHAETRLLLPWLANGTLEGAELERVQAHLEGCPACREELALECDLRAGRQDGPGLCAGRAFARLAPRLGPQETRARSTGRWAGLAAANDVRWLRVLVAAQFGALLVLGLALGLSLARHEQGEASYRTLGAHAAARADIVVRFNPATPERELRRVLEASGARVVDGPTAAGAWMLAAAPAGIAPALRRLRAEPAVTLAEPLAVEGAP